MTELNATELAELTGRAEKTVRRRLAKPPALAPVRSDGRTQWFRSSEALDRILGRPGSGAVRRSDDERLAALRALLPLGGKGALTTVRGDELGIDWEDLRELLGWGLPFAQADATNDAAGWRIAPGLYVRWCTLMLAALAQAGVEIDDQDEDPVVALAHELRRLRGDEPLRLPAGFAK